MYEELAIWRRENGFDRVVEGEESCFMFIARFRPPRSNTMPACGQSERVERCNFDATPEGQQTHQRN